ncbi:glucose-1-phosphate adenylyltransferase [bacterium]|nr:MAG: glucose-1-phosphate adenylyltransferase [bacterium]
MNHPRVLTLVLAGGEGNRLGPLTENRAKPVAPFLGAFRLLDFVLSNVAHSQLRDVWILEQFQAHSINEHLCGGRPWDLDRTHGGLQILPPFQGNPESGWHEGNADALWRNARIIRQFNPDLVLVLSADAVYRLDYREVIEAHQKLKAEVTMVSTSVPREEATRFGNIETDKTNRVSRFVYKPDEPLGKGKEAQVTCEVFVYDAQVLLDTLDQLATGDGQTPEEAALSDFGHELLPHFVERGRAYSFEMNGFWRDVGTLDSYFDTQMEFLDSPPFDMNDSACPIWTRPSAVGPTRLAPKAKVENCLLGAGANIAGQAKNCIIGPNVCIEEGAEVEDCILNGNARVKAGVRLKRVIVDEGTTVSKDETGKKHVAVVT